MVGQGETAAARVVVLVGPSGSGKSYLARTSGLPVLNLDDFYRDGDDPDLPRGPDGSVDWEDCRSWDGGEAFAALSALCRGERVEVPVYSMADDRRVGTREVTLDGARSFVTEGIFAGTLIGPLDRSGLLADAIYLHRCRWANATRRLTRDLRERRKSPAVAVRLGWRKLREEPRMRARFETLGARASSLPAARRDLAELAGLGDLGTPGRPDESHLARSGLGSLQHG